MFKYAMLLLVLCVAGCQTTQLEETPDLSSTTLIDQSEKLLIRIDKIVGTYDVVVQRFVFNGDQPDDENEWEILGTARVSGYPGTFRTLEEALPVVEGERKATFLLDETVQEISHEPGVHMIVKVEPELQNTARVVGVYVQVTTVGDAFETFTMPFDIKVNLGDVLQLYSKEVPVAVSVLGTSESELEPEDAPEPDAELEPEDAPEPDAELELEAAPESVPDVDQ